MLRLVLYVIASDAAVPAVPTLKTSSESLPVRIPNFSEACHSPGALSTPCCRCNQYLHGEWHVTSEDGRSRTEACQPKGLAWLLPIRLCCLSSLSSRSSSRLLVAS